MTPRTPSGLGAAGKRLYREIVADVNEAIELDAKDLQALERAAVLADLVELLREDIRVRGSIVEGSTGRMQANPRSTRSATCNPASCRCCRRSGSIPSRPGPGISAGSSARASRAIGAAVSRSRPSSREELTPDRLWSLWGV
jgi:hypothetical protein